MSRAANKIKPFADAIRAKLRELAPLGCAVFSFRPGEWEPTARFWKYSADSMGFVLTVRNYNEATYVFRIA